jgi:uncharacterized protein
MNSLVFEELPRAFTSAPERTDVACFVGFVARRTRTSPRDANVYGGWRTGVLPDDVQRFLEERGWLARIGSRPAPHARPEARELRDVPVLIESWDAFDRLFAWDSRPLDGDGRTCVSWLGAAVRSFFAQGGRRCYVVRMGDPWQYTNRRGRRLTRIATLLPGYPQMLTPNPVDLTTWHGVGHLCGLPDVSFLCLPDLAELVAADVRAPARTIPVAGIEEHFVECSAEIAEPEDSIARRFQAPRADAAAYRYWTLALERLVAFLRRRRDVRLLECATLQIIAALPIPREGSSEENELAKSSLDRLTNVGAVGSEGIVLEQPWPSSAAVQLAYPWARTPTARRLPEGLESPDGVLAGVLARNALARGTFFGAAGLSLGDVFDVAPQLDRAQMSIPVDVGSRAPHERSLIERVTLLGPTPSGMRLLSDVTTSTSETYRSASVPRLISALARAARRLGEEVGFEPSGEELWARLRSILDATLDGLWRAGALRGISAADAYQVRCDRTTMTQSDIDDGRVIADVSFTPALPIERIHIILSLRSAGDVSLLAAPALPEVA